MKQGNGRTRGLALGLLAALMVMGLSGTAMAKWWKGSHTEKWHEKKWDSRTVLHFPHNNELPPTEEQEAQFTVNHYPEVNVEGWDGNVASRLYFYRNGSSPNNININIKEGGRLVIGAPGKVAQIDAEDDGKPRISTQGTGLLTFNPRSNNVQIKVARGYFFNNYYEGNLYLGATDVPKMMDADGGVYQTGCVTLIGRIKALGGHEPWRLRDSRLTVERAEYLDLPAPDVLKL